MGADTKSLRNRIKSVDSTLHLTKAMGLVAASKIRRATEKMNQSREYADSLGNVISLLTSCPECSKSPFMAQRKGDRTRFVIIAGDRGLAGGYNSNIFKAAKEYPAAEFIPVGKRACERYGGNSYVAETFTYNDAVSVSEKLCKDFENDEYDKFGIIKTKYISMMSQEVQIEWVLPVHREDKKQNRSVLFEPDEATILNIAIREYVAGTIIAAVRESFACEIAARRSAMDSAGKNAQQMIDELRLEYNRARQGAITQELTEIVAGSDE